LIHGGAKVNSSARKNETESALVNALCSSDRKGNPMRCADTKLVDILLRAGAIVNPGFGKSPLAHAAESGHVKAVELLVSAGADVHFMEECGSTPLVSAVKCKTNIPDGDVISIARILLEAGADPQAKSRKGPVIGFITVLQKSIERRSIDLIQLLLNNGARVTESAFVCASEYCDVNIAKLLLKFGGKVTEMVIGAAVKNDDPKLVFFLLEAADEKTRTRGKIIALRKYLEQGKIDLVDSLEAGGAQLGRNFNLNYGIQKATERGDLRVLRLLLDGESKFRARDIKPVGGMLLTAIGNGRYDIVELLLTSGAEVTGGIGNETALLAAIRLKDEHLVRKLLIAGAQVSTTYSFGSAHDDKDFQVTFCLPTVAKWGHYPLIWEMINAGADVNAQETGGSETSLYFAVENKDLPMVKLLLDAGADVNAPMDTTSGNRALEAACRNNDREMVRYLLDLGAEPDDESLVAAVSRSLDLVRTLLASRLNRYKRFSKGFGCRALQRAIELEHAEMIEILLTSGIDANTVIRYRIDEDILNPDIVIEESALRTAIKTDKSNSLWVVKILVCGGADLNSIVGGNETALLAAINQNSLPLVKMLIAAGANANLGIILGVKRTPLQLAAEKGSMDITKILLQHGADVNAPPYDRYGATALQFAAIGGYVGLANLLIERGADVNASPAKVGGRTALEGAAEHGRIDMLQLLLSAGAFIGPGSEQYESAREFAWENGHVSATRLLEKHKAENSSFMQPDMLGDFPEWDTMSMGLGSMGVESMEFAPLDDFQF
jgi:ankyrin repeat protein